MSADQDANTKQDDQSEGNTGSDAGTESTDTGSAPGDEPTDK